MEVTSEAPRSFFETFGNIFQEMTVVEVNRRLLNDLEAMGFPHPRAAWALHHSSNVGLEQAVNWIIDHENDPKFDEMPLVVFNIDIESTEPSNVTESAQARAEKLSQKARKKREEEEKKLEREREKERVRAGKELFETKRIAEENERKRNIAFRKAEKDEEKRARDKILQKIEADKLGRRMAFPTETPIPVSNKKVPMMYTHKPFPKSEQLRECLRTLRRNHKDNDARVSRAFQTLLIYVRNVARNPDEEKYRRIRLTNPLFHDRVGSLKGGVEYLELCGFKRKEGSEFLYLPRDSVDMSALHDAAFHLSSAMTNPFFGILSREESG